MLGDDQMEKAAGGGSAEVPPKPRLDIEGKLPVPGGDIGRDDILYYEDIADWHFNVQPGEKMWYDIERSEGCNIELTEKQWHSVEGN